MSGCDAYLLEVFAQELRDIQNQLLEIDLPGGEDDGASDPPTTPDGFAARAAERLLDVIRDLERAWALSNEVAPCAD